MTGDEPDGEDNRPNDDDDDVGYCKPPKKTQFKPGNPGRPKGSGKRSFNMADILTEAMSRKRKVRRGDRVVSMRVGEIYVERLITMATSGSPSDMMKVLAAIAKRAPNLLTTKEIEARVTYHRAPGSNVDLPPANLWKRDEDG